MEFRRKAGLLKAAIAQIRPANITGLTANFVQARTIEYAVFSTGIASQVLTCQFEKFHLTGKESSLSSLGYIFKAIRTRYLWTMAIILGCSYF